MAIEGVPDLRWRQALGRIAPAILGVLVTTCSSPTKPGPVIVELVIQSVSPSAGPATGGTELTIRGTGFAAGTAVTVGGRAATDITVRGSDTITAKTPASAIAGAVDIAVLLNGKTGTLAGGFRYEVTTNNAPIIKSIVARGKRLRQPANFADYGETIVLTAVVEDAQTAPALLAYQWLTCGGTVTGTGAQVDWQIPASLGLPSICTIELIVSDGSRVATGSVPVRLHNSTAELAALAVEFLEEFANSAIPAETTIRNFSDVPNECRLGKAAELGDVQRNRTNYRHLFHTYGSTTVTINFGGICAFRTRSADACIATPVEWRSTKLDTETLEVAKGTSQITGVYESSRWWLCRSELQDPITTSGLTFMY